MWFFKKEKKQISAKEAFEIIKNEKVNTIDLYHNRGFFIFFLSWSWMLFIITVGVSALLASFITLIGLSRGVEFAEINQGVLMIKAFSFLIPIAIGFFSFGYYFYNKNIMRIRKRFKKEVLASKNYIEFLNKIFDKLDDNYFLEQAENIMEIYNFRSVIRDDTESYLKNRIGNDKFKELIFKNEHFLKTYMKKMNLKDVIKFYFSKEDRGQINKHITDIEFLKLRKSIIDPEIEEYMESAQTDNDSEVYRYLIEIEGDKDYINLLGNRLGIVKKESDLLNQINKELTNGNNKKEGILNVQF